MNTLTGYIFKSREDLYKAGLHNSYQKGIGKSKDGLNRVSIVLSGGYIDDEDYGDEIIYTGEGGRDPKTKKQTSDQQFNAGNLDLLKAFELGEPVYLTRGHTHKTKYSPKHGYQFFGDFYITEHWVEKGIDGFNIIRFKLVKYSEKIGAQITDGIANTNRIAYTSTRIVRDTKLSVEVKSIYNYRCQVCDVIITLPSGDRYAEGAHIKPLGIPHNGPDILSNILCLCPNHHLMFDKYSFSINPIDQTISELEYKVLKTDDRHNIGYEYLKYHWDNYLNHKKTYTQKVD